MIKEKEKDGQNIEITNHYVTLYLNHPIEERCEVMIPFRTESEAREFLLHILSLLTDDVAAELIAVDDHTTADGETE